MKSLIEEVVAVANAAEIQIATANHLMEAALKLGDAMASATSSTQQDLSLGRLTEIDSLNGYVIRRGRELDWGA